MKVLHAFLLFLVGCSSVPGGIRDEIARSPKGTATVVVFTDFQCPFCRRLHAKLDDAAATHPNMRVVLRHVPLHSHPDARGAAKAAICAEKLLPRDASVAVEDVFYKSSDLSEASCVAIVARQGVDEARVRACMSDPAIDARLAADEELFDAAQGSGVPLLYVGRTRLDGEPSEGELDAALAEAHR